MPKISQIKYTAMTWKLHDGYDSDIDEHVHNTLSLIDETNWILLHETDEHYADRSKIYRRVGSDLAVVFVPERTGDEGNDRVTYRILPSVYPLNSDGEPIKGQGSLSNTPFAFPSPIGPFYHGEKTENGNMRYTACEGKNGKAWTVSVVQENKTFDVYDAYVGIDSSGAPYAIAASNYNGETAIPRAMEFSVYGHQMQGTYPSMQNSVSRSMQSQIGFGPNGSNLTLIPLINPFNGATCTDLYIAQGGPRDTMLYDITINGRRFVTGASNNTEPNEGMTIESYAPEFKIFMEV